MLQNNNGAVIKKLTHRSLKSNKNYIVILAIALATLLFTSMFTIVGSLKVSMQDSNMRKVGSSAHAGLKHLTMQEYQEVAQDSAVKDISYSSIIGTAKGEVFRKLPAEVRWGDNKYAKWTFNFPTNGKMPQAENEIATSTLVLDALGVSHEIGQKIKLSVTTDEKTFTDIFTLSGIWDGDMVSYRKTIWLSHNYADKVAPLADSPSNGESNLSTGYIDGIMMFSSAWNIEKQINNLAARHKLNVPIGVNGAYETAEIDLQNIIAVILSVIVIFIAGYLLIYNIFYISVAQDIHSYGLLKTIGTTSRQIRKIVRRKAMILSCIGIPLGLLLGWPIGRILVPFIISILGEDMRVVTTVNPSIFALSAFFSLLTVYLSCVRPARLASKVSPIEAVRYTEKGQKVNKKKKTKHAHRVSPCSMAIDNLLRNRKKVTVVVLSFSLSLVILNSTYTYVHSFDFDKFVSTTSISDFSVADASIINSSSPFNTNGVSNNFIDKVKSLAGLEKSGNIYLFKNHQSISIDAHTHLKKQIDSWDNKKKMDVMNSQAMVKKVSVVNTLGFDTWPAESIKVLSGKLDNARWTNGQGIYVTPCKMIGNGSSSIYKPGDTIDVDLGNHKKKKYKVLAIVDYPEALNSPEHYDLGLEYLLPSSEFLSNFGVRKPMRTMFNVDDSHLAMTENWLENYCLNIDSGLDFWSRNSLQKTFQNLAVMYNTVGGTLCIILAVIGVLNFINSMITSILTRQREIAMLQAVGMTNKQTRAMLICEGAGYATLGLILSLILASIANITLVRAMGVDLYYFTWRFTLIPVILCAIPLIFITVLVPILCYRKISKNSVVQRLRVAE